MRDRAAGTFRPEDACGGLGRKVPELLQTAAGRGRSPQKRFCRSFSYTYSAVPQILKAVTLRPWKIAKYATLGYLIGQIGYLLTGTDEDEHRELLSERDQGLTWIGLPRE